jgi:Cupin domain
MVIDEPPAAWSLPAHRHAIEDETIHIVAGEFEMVLDGERTRLSAGKTIHIPKGVVRSSGNVGSQAGRRIVLFGPAGMASFFLEAGLPSPQRETDVAAAAASATRFGRELVVRESSDGMQS